MNVGLFSTAQHAIFQTPSVSVGKMRKSAERPNLEVRLDRSILSLGSSKKYMVANFSGIKKESLKRLSEQFVIGAFVVDMGIEPLKIKDNIRNVYC